MRHRNHKHPHTHTYRQRPCQTPDYPTSPCRCSSQCRAHTSFGTPGRLKRRKKRRTTGEGEHQWPKFETEVRWRSRRTCTEVRLAASAQDGVELGLVRSHFVFASRVEFLSPKHTWRMSSGNATGPMTVSYCADITNNVPGRPVAPGRCPRSPFRPDFPKHSQESRVFIVTG